MKKLFFVLTFCLAFNAFSQENKPYNKPLADSLKADDYGMKTYYLVMLTTGKPLTDKAKSAEAMQGHMQNINRLAKEGILVVAGPFLEDNAQHYEGLFILNAETKEAAENMVKTDPAVKAGIFGFELFKWYGSATLPLYLKHHEEVAKIKF